MLEIIGGQSSVSDLLAKEKNDAYKITVEPNDDGTLTVYLKAKSGYIYYGDPSAGRYRNRNTKGKTRRKKLWVELLQRSF